MFESENEFSQQFFFFRFYWFVNLTIFVKDNNFMDKCLHSELVQSGKKKLIKAQFYIECI